MPSTKGLLSNIWWSGILSLGLWVVSAAHAETQTSPQTITAEASKPQSGIQATGYIDLRPSWITKSGNFTSEDTAELGAKLSADTSLTYMQGFNTNIYDPVSPTDNSGMRPQLDAGAIKTKVNNIWKNDVEGLSLAYENRIYIPVDEASQNRGLITSVRNYLKLSKSFSDNFKLTLNEIVIPMIHSRSGNISSSGQAVANGVFENRVYLVTDVQLTSKLSLSVPVMFHQTRTANFRSDAANNAAWSFHVWTSPELDYAVNDNLTLGLSYYNNDSFFTPNLSKAQFGQALESGEFQFVLTASL
jgi:hypothetical protein